MRRECQERFVRHRLQKKLLVSAPGMHHGTYMTHVPLCMSRSLTSGGGETFPAFPAHAQPAILRIWPIVWVGSVCVFIWLYRLLQIKVLLPWSLSFWLFNLHGVQRFQDSLWQCHCYCLQSAKIYILTRHVEYTDIKMAQCHHFTQKTMRRRFDVMMTPLFRHVPSGTRLLSKVIWSREKPIHKNAPIHLYII